MKFVKKVLAALASDRPVRDAVLAAVACAVGVVASGGSDATAKAAFIAAAYGVLRAVVGFAAGKAVAAADAAGK